MTKEKQLSRKNRKKSVKKTKVWTLGFGLVVIVLAILVFYIFFTMGAAIGPNLPF